MAALETLFPVFFMIGLGMVSRMKGWLTLEQKAGANTIIFDILFPMMIFNLMMTAKIEASTSLIVSYVLVVFILAHIVGIFASKFTGEKFGHVVPYMMMTCEGGNVALPLYLSIVGASSNTVIFDIAGSITAFVVIPIIVAKAASNGATFKDLIKNIFSNTFMIAVVSGLTLNLTGLYQAFSSTALGPVYTGTISMVTSPIVGMILFLIGYDLKFDKDTLAPILKLMVVRIVFYSLVIAGFFIFFSQLMKDPIYLMAVLIYFMCPTGFAMPAIIRPIVKKEEDNQFMSAFMSLYMIVTLIVYTVCVVFIA